MKLQTVAMLQFICTQNTASKLFSDPT